MSRTTVQQCYCSLLAHNYIYKCFLRAVLHELLIVFASHLACDEERTEAAKLLVEHGASIYIENKEKMTPLQVSKGGLGSVLKRIVEGWWTLSRNGAMQLELLIKLLFKYDEYLFMRVLERNTVEELLCAGSFYRCLLKRSTFTFWQFKSSWLDIFVTFHAFYSVH